MTDQSRLSKVFGSKTGSSSGSVTPFDSKRTTASPVQPKQGEVKQITIQMPTIAIRIDDHFKAKLPFLLLMFLLFAFSLVLLEKANFHAIDLVDIERLQYNASKLWSISFLLFTLLYSFAVALAMFYGFGQNWGSTIFVALGALVIAGAASFLYPTGSYPFAFVSLALTLCAASFVSNFRTRVKFSSIYSTAGTALLVLIVLSFFVAFTQIAANKDVFIDTFIASGVTASLTQTQSPSVGSLLSPQMRNDITQQFTNSITEQRVRSWFEGIPDFNKLSDKIQTSTITGVRKNLTKDLRNELPDLLSNIQISSGTPSDGGTDAVKQALGQTPAFVAFYNNFALLMAVSVASIVAVFAFVIKLVATLLCWLLAKL